MLISALLFLLKTAASLLVSACLLRLWGQYVRLAPHGQIPHMTRTVTNWLVMPLRKFIPGVGGIDWASLAAAYLTCLALSLLVMLLGGAFWSRGLAGGLLSGFSLMPAVTSALLLLLNWGLSLIFWVVLASAILSWVNPMAPLAPALDQLSSLFLNPIRRLLPAMGGLDLSPMVLLFALQALTHVIERMTLSFLPFM